MIIEKLLGRQYYTIARNTVYTIRGVADGTGTIAVIGEYADPSNVNSETRLASHKLNEVHLITNPL